MARTKTAHHRSAHTSKRAVRTPTRRSIRLKQQNVSIQQKKQMEVKVNLASLPDELMDRIYGYLGEDGYVGGKARKVSNCASTCKNLHRMKLQETHMKKKTAVVYSKRVLASRLILDRLIDLNKLGRHKKTGNDQGYKFGQQVKVVRDNMLNPWKGYKHSKLVGKHAWVVGVTPTAVYIVWGNLFEKHVSKKMKKNVSIRKV